MNFKNVKTIAIIGLSDNPDRASYKVAKFFLEKGYKIIPVNPNIEKFLGLSSYKNIDQIPSNITVDIFDIFRKSDDVVGVVKEIISSKRKAVIWLQENIINQEACDLAKENGLEMTMGWCLMKDYLKNIQN